MRMLFRLVDAADALVLDRAVLARGRAEIRSARPAA